MIEIRNVNCFLSQEFRCFFSLSFFLIEEISLFIRICKNHQTDLFYKETKATHFANQYGKKIIPKYKLYVHAILIRVICGFTYEIRFVDYSVD